MMATGMSGASYDLSAKPIKSGGEGEIYDIIGNPGSARFPAENVGPAGRPDFFPAPIVAKMYKPGKATIEKEQKLLKMVENPPGAAMLSQIAWPQDVLYNGRQFSGFTMPKMNVNEDLNVIYEYGASAKYPLMTWSNKITIAQNLCAVLDSIHESGHVCGDLNPRNISVNPTTGHIIFLDTDSYHIQDGREVYRCDVGIPEYLPAEVQAKMRGGTNLANASLPTFSEYTDNFALAVHIFQLLMNGVHPFACAIIPSQSSVVAPQPADGILRGEFPFMQDIQGLRIPAYAPEMGILPYYVQRLFEYAFVSGHANPGARPSTVEWHDALKSLKGELRLCAYAAHHLYFAALPSCPWCDVDRKFLNIARAKRPLSQEAIGPVAAAPHGKNVFVAPPQAASASASAQPSGSNPASPPQPAATSATTPPSGKNVFVAPPQGAATNIAAPPPGAAGPASSPPAYKTAHALNISHAGAPPIAAVSFHDKLRKRIRSELFVVSIACAAIAAFLSVDSVNGALWFWMVNSPYPLSAYFEVAFFSFVAYPIVFMPVICQILIIANAARPGGLVFPLFLYKIYAFICVAHMLLFSALSSWSWGFDNRESVAAVVFAPIALLYLRAVIKVIDSVRQSIKLNSDAPILMEPGIKSLVVYTAIVGGVYAANTVLGELEGFWILRTGITSRALLISVIGTLPLVALIYNFQKKLKKPQTPVDWS